MKGLLFGALAGGLYIALSWVPENVYEPISAVTARTTAAVIGLWGLEPRVAGTHIFLEGFAVRIIPECTAVFAIALFWAFVFAAPARIADRISGLLLGTPVLFAANGLRLAAVTAWGAWRPADFHTAHAWFGQVFMAFSVIAACWVWMSWAERKHRDSAPVRLAVRFLAISSALFFVWVHASAGYVKGVDRFLAILFSLFDVRLAFDYRHAVYYETFNVVVCLALVLSFPIGAMTKKWRVLALWALAIVAGHAAGRICNVLFTAFDVWQAKPISIAVNVIGQYAIPLGLWIQLRAWKQAARKAVARANVAGLPGASRPGKGELRGSQKKEPGNSGERTKHSVPKGSRPDYPKLHASVIMP